MDAFAAASYGTAALLALYPAYRAYDVWQRERRWVELLAQLPTDGSDEPARNNVLEDRFVGCLVGGAIGDALGRMGESLPSWLVRLRFGTITDFHAGLLRRVRGLGSVTDDTQLTLCVARSIGYDGSCDPILLQRLFCDWYDYRVGPGKATTAAVLRLRQHVEWEQAGDRGSAGNGTVIRVAPIGLVWHHDNKRRRQQAEWSAMGTHGHPDAIAGARIVADAIAYALKRTAQKPADLITHLLAKETDPTWKKALTLVQDLNSEMTDKSLRRVGTSGYVVHTVSAALLLFQKLGDSPQAALVTAANAGGDTDSIGAVLGNLLGAWHGMRALPERLRRQVQGHGALTHEARRLLAIHQHLKPGVLFP
jgi:ADP-ribosyl-[dinitrogen reductase] hydrolase